MAQIHTICWHDTLHPVAQWQCQKKNAFSQRVRPFWRDTCADLIMTLTVIGRNWLNPAHVLGWSYHFTKKNAPAVSTVPISLLTMWLNHKKLAKIVDLKISSCSFPPKPKSQAVLPKAQNFGSVVFGMCQLQFGWLFRRVCPSKCLAAFFFGEVEALLCWILSPQPENIEKYLPTKRFLGIQFSWCTCSIHVHVQYMFMFHRFIVTHLTCPGSLFEMGNFM